MIEAVIFDMDGVLADTEYYYENRRKNFLLENGIPIPEGNFIGSNEKAIWEAIVPNDPVRRQRIRDLLAAESIELNGSAAGKQDVLNKMVDLMAKSGKIRDMFHRGYPSDSFGNSGADLSQLFQQSEENCDRNGL